jgi:hypothetical protein
MSLTRDWTRSMRVTRGIAIRAAILSSVLTAWAGTCSAAAESAAGAHGFAPHCEVEEGQVLAAGRRVRVFSETRKARTHAGGFEREDIFACLRGAEHRWWLNRPDRPPYSDVSIDTTTFAVHAPWVAYVTSRHGIDTSVLGVHALEMKTGYAFDCEIGGTRAPQRSPAVVKLLLRRNGTAAFTAEANGGFLYGESGEATPLADRAEREVVACRPFGRKVLDRADDIETSSLTLRGALLTWRDGGAPQSSSLAE